MPIGYVIADKGSLVYTHGYGTVLAADLEAHERRLLADPRVAAGYRQMLDCRWVSEDSDAAALFGVLAADHRRADAKLRGARYAVVAHGPHWFDLGAQTRCEPTGVTLIVFNDPGTACIWLGANCSELAGYRLELPTPVSVNQAAGLVPAY